MQNTNKHIIGKPQTRLLMWLLVPFIFASLLDGFLLSVVKSSVTQLQEAVHVSTTLLEIQPYTGEQTGMVSFWFDDAWKSEYNNAFPLMRAAGLRGSLAVPTELIGFPAYMTWPQVIEVQETGWEINAHSRIHDCNISELSYEELEDEILGSRLDLEHRNLFNDIYVLPCGVFDERVLEIAQTQYTAIRTSDSDVETIPVKNPYDIQAFALESTTTLADVAEWIEDAEKQKGWLNLMFHAVTTRQGPEVDEYTVSPAFLAGVIDLVKKSSLKVALPSEVLAITEDQWAGVLQQ